MIITRKIIKEDADYQVRKLLSYCFTDTVGWIERLFPLYNNESFHGIYSGKNLSSCLLSRNYKASLYNSVQPLNGIACVASWPEKRNQGHVRRLITEVISDEYREGKIFSALYPFKFQFYEQFGYGMISGFHSCLVSPGNLKVMGKPAGEFIRFNESEEQLADIFAIRDQWTADYNFGIQSSRYPLEKYIADIQWQKGHEYLYIREGNCKANIRFTLHTVGEHQMRLSIQKIAWADAESFQALIYFLHTHRDQCSQIEWRLPSNLPLSLILYEPRINMMIQHHWMARPLNVMKIIELKLQQNPLSGNIIFSIKDEIIADNTGTYLIDGNTLKKEKFNDTNTIPFPIFSSLLFGGCTPGDLKLTGLFTQKFLDPGNQFFRKEYNLYLSESF